MTPDDDAEDIDPGLARERTELAWHRTAISVAALGAAILKIRLAAGVTILIISAVVWGWACCPAYRAPGTRAAGGSW